MEFDPTGYAHIPIGIPNTLDALKTFVESEGNFSPGVGTYGICFWLYHPDQKIFAAPTMPGIHCDHGLYGKGLPIPWSAWVSNGIKVSTEVCHVLRHVNENAVHVVGSRVHLTNTEPERRKVSLYVALRPLGAAGNAVHHISVGKENDVLYVDGNPALIAQDAPQFAGVSDRDTVGEEASAGRVPVMTEAFSESGDACGCLRYDLYLEPEACQTIHIICPVLAGRRAPRHDWISLPGQNAQVDRATPNPQDGGLLQHNPGVDYYRSVACDDLFRDAVTYWTSFLSNMDMSLPDQRWVEGFNAMLVHASLSMNEDAPDVAVVNYNVYNRDGIYIANMLQKAGRFDYSECIIDYFIGNPFNGRPHPEADNPGQVLWIMGEHWRMTHDRDWLDKVFPSVSAIAEMIEYYRFSEGPHWVCMKSLKFGDDAPEELRQELKPGRCDGFHPEYTEAFDIAGLRAAADLAKGIGDKKNHHKWSGLAGQLLQLYTEKFGTRLPDSYGSYCVLWPCRLYGLNEGPAYHQFKDCGAVPMSRWRYFAPATAHQGLLTGNRESGSLTIAEHLAHEQMQGWYAFDEGGHSGSGGWHHLRTNWKHDKAEPGTNRARAMPHGWAIAELWLLMRDSLVFEDDNDRLVLFAGIPSEWFQHPGGMRVKGMRTYHGEFSFEYRVEASSKAVLHLQGNATPPGGYGVRVPQCVRRLILQSGEALQPESDGVYSIPEGVCTVYFQF